MNNIWHKAGFHEAIDDKIKVSRNGKLVYWTMYGWNIPDKDVHDIGCEWAYLDDLLALETELERTRKALDFAVDALKSAHNYYEYCVQCEDNDCDTNWDCTAMNMDNDISEALEQITALEQKETSPKNVQK